MMNFESLYRGYRKKKLFTRVIYRWRGADIEDITASADLHNGLYGMSTKAPRRVWIWM